MLAHVFILQEKKLSSAIWLGKQQRYKTVKKKHVFYLSSIIVVVFSVTAATIRIKEFVGCSSSRPSLICSLISIFHPAPEKRNAKTNVHLGFIESY